MNIVIKNLKRKNYLQIQKYFTLALLVLLVTNIMPGHAVLSKLRLGDLGWEGRPETGGLEGAEGEGGADVEGVEEVSGEDQGENGRKHPHG